jgi:hypothetical protein
MAHVGMRRAAPAMLFVSLVAPVFADQPLLRPSRDIDVTYRSAAPQDGRPVEQRVRWLAASQTMRIDPPAPGLHVIIDYVARRMSVVRDATRSVIEMAAPDGMADAIGGNAGRGYVRRGQATVAGRACTEWQTRDSEAHTVLVCITEDGVLLRAGTVEHVRVSAVSVQYAPQDPATFRVPIDYVHRGPGAAR